MTDELLELVTLETNKYASEYLQMNKGRLKEHSNFKKWPENGIMGSVKTKQLYLSL